MKRRPKKLLPPAFTRGHFRTAAARIPLVAGGVRLGDLRPTEFSKKSLGWTLSTRTQVSVGGVMVDVQFTFNATVLGSAALPEEPPCRPSSATSG